MRFFLKPQYLTFFIVCVVLSFSGSSRAEVEDNRDASFMPSPALKRMEPVLEEAVDAKTKKKKEEKKDLSAPPPFEHPDVKKPKAKKKVTMQEAAREIREAQRKKAEAARKLLEKDKALKVQEKPTVLKQKEKTEEKKEAPVKSTQGVKKEAVVTSQPTQSIKEEPSKIIETKPEPAPIAKPVNLGAPVASAPLPDVDPETLGLLSPTQGGLGALLWKDASRPLVDRLMPAIALPTSSYTLNDLARRMFLTTAAAPAPGTYGHQPKRTLMSQRIEGLMNLGAVREAWKLFLVAEPSLVDPVTLTRLVEASLIGPDGAEVCEAVSGLMAAQAKQNNMQLDWQKSLLICQLRGGKKEAVQLSLATMKEQSARRDAFMQVLERNVLGSKKRLPRHLTPLRPTVLALLSEAGRPLPSYLYKKPAAYLVPELVKIKAQKEKDRVALAERSAGKGVLTKKQLMEVYESVVTGKTKKKSTTSAAINRAILFHAAKNEELPQKKITLIKGYLKELPPQYHVGVPGQIAADVLDTVPVAADYNSSAVYMARIFALTGRMDKAMQWLAMARDVASRVERVGHEIEREWPVFVLAGMVADGDYAQGLKAWLKRVLSEGDKQVQRDYAGRVLLLLSSCGYAVPEVAWQAVVELHQPVKQKVHSPVLLERMHQVARAGRRGETILLSLLLQAGGEPPLGVTADTVRALRLAGLKAEMQSLAREVLVSLTPVK